MVAVVNVNIYTSPLAAFKGQNVSSEESVFANEEA